MASLMTKSASVESGGSRSPSRMQGAFAFTKAFPTQRRRSAHPVGARLGPLQPEPACGRHRTSVDLTHSSRRSAMIAIRAMRRSQVAVAEDAVAKVAATSAMLGIYLNLLSTSQQPRAYMSPRDSQLPRGV
jgi:hypothetical protein